MFIEQYFDKIKEVINQCPLVYQKSIDIDIRSEYIGHIEGALFFLDDTVLYFREIVDVERGVDRIKYTYHYQHQDSLVRIFRYDNARHHPHISTFPHHKHIGNEGISDDNLTESTAPILTEVLKEIEDMYMYRKSFYENNS